MNKQKLQVRVIGDYTILFYDENNDCILREAIETGLQEAKAYGDRMVASGYAASYSIDRRVANSLFNNWSK